MKNNRIMWGIVSLVVLVTLAVSFGTMSSHSQQGNSKQPHINVHQDSRKYAIVDYDAPEPKNAAEREKRTLKNKRYDDQILVQKNPHPDDSGVSLFDEITPPDIIPAAESNLIIIGEVINAKAYLSNDKTGIYTEFIIRINDVLKSDVSNKINQGDSIIADRTGGIVRYPNGQQVLYKIAEKDLPQVGSQYALFLTTDKTSPNYEILTGHKLKADNIAPLDTERRFDDFKNINKLNFIKAIRNKISESLPSGTNKGERHEN